MFSSYVAVPTACYRTLYSREKMAALIANDLGVCVAHDGQQIIGLLS